TPGLPLSRDRLLSVNHGRGGRRTDRIRSRLSPLTGGFQPVLQIGAWKSQALRQVRLAQRTFVVLPIQVDQADIEVRESVVLRKLGGAFQLNVGFLRPRGLLQEGCVNYADDGVVRLKAKRPLKV